MRTDLTASVGGRMNLLGGLALLFGKQWGITIAVSLEVRWRVNNILWNRFLKKNAGGKRAFERRGQS